MCYSKGELSLSHAWDSIYWYSTNIFLNRLIKIRAEYIIEVLGVQQSTQGEIQEFQNVFEVYRHYALHSLISNSSYGNSKAILLEKSDLSPQYKM